VHKDIVRIFLLSNEATQILGPLPEICENESREDVKLKLREIRDKLEYVPVSLQDATFQDFVSL
jgi:hypothetical protein